MDQTQNFQWLRDDEYHLMRRPFMSYLSYVKWVSYRGILLWGVITSSMRLTFVWSVDWESNYCDIDIRVSRSQIKHGGSVCRASTEWKDLKVKSKS